MKTQQKKIKVLFVIPNLTFGGIQTQVLHLAKYFIDELGFNVTIWGIYSSENNFTKILEDKAINYEMHPEIDDFFSIRYVNAGKLRKLKMWHSLWSTLMRENFKIILPYTKKIDLIFNII